MTLETITRAQLAKDLGLLDESGQVSERAVAYFLRAPLARWGLSPKRAVLKYVRDQLRAGGIGDLSCVDKVFQRLLTLGEFVELFVGHEPFVAPAEPRWFPVGVGAGVFLGVSGPPKGISHAIVGGQNDIVQRIQVASDEEAAILEVAGVREISMDEWISPLSYLHHAERRARRPVRSDLLTLSGYWDMLEEILIEEGLPLSPDAEVRAITGEPGQFFGRENAPDPEGRWTASAPDGIWCAFRRGYGETHWHPSIVSVSGEERRALDLYDRDEWRWALLARGRRLGREEVLYTENDSLRLTFPPPLQLGTAMDLVGVRTAPWVWELNSGSPDVWSLIP